MMIKKYLTNLNTDPATVTNCNRKTTVPKNMFPAQSESRVSERKPNSTQKVLATKAGRNIY
jgi:hypothetical protein